MNVGVSGPLGVGGSKSSLHSGFVLGYVACGASELQMLMASSLSDSIFGLRVKVDSSIFHFKPPQRPPNAQEVDRLWNPTAMGASQYSTHAMAAG